MAEGFHAYNEFLLGLEKINQQEYVKPGFSGPKIHGDKLDAFKVRHDFPRRMRMQKDVDRKSPKTGRMRGDGIRKMRARAFAPSLLSSRLLFSLA